MRKNTFKKILLLILIVQIVMPKSVVNAKELEFPELNMELNIPEDTIILTTDTSITDEKWSSVGISDPTSEIETMEQMGVEYIFFDKATDTKVSLLSKQSSQSKDIFHLSSLSEKEFDKFLLDTFAVEDENTTFRAKKYSQSETPFFRLYIELTQNNQHFSELVYGTIVNGALISFHVYDENNTEVIDESFIKTIVDGVHFTEYHDKEEIKKQERFSIISSLVPVLTLIVIVASWLFISKKKKEKLENYKKRRTEKLSAFHLKKRKTGYNDKDKPLFVNTSEYSHALFQPFFFYNEVLNKISYWIKLSLLYIVILVLLYIAKASSITFIIIILLMIAHVYITKVKIEKLVEQEMKFFNISKSTTIKFQFYEDYFNMSGDKVDVNYPYPQIIKIVEYKDYIYIYIDIDKAVYLTKNGFDQDYNDFIKFINQR